MRVEVPHTLERAVAVKRIDDYVTELVQRQLPAGVEVKEVQKHWDGDRLTFSARAKKGFMGTTVSGTLEVTDQAVVVESALPALVTGFLGEDRIKDKIREHLGRIVQA